MNDEIASKIEQLVEYVNILKGYQHFKIEDFQGDHTLKGAVERYLEIALENAKIDIEKLHYYLQNNIGDIEQFGKYIAQYLIKSR